VESGEEAMLGLAEMAWKLAVLRVYGSFEPKWGLVPFCERIDCDTNNPAHCQYYWIIDSLEKSLNACREYGWYGPTYRVVP
jgi:hypothetical protein